MTPKSSIFFVCLFVCLLGFFVCLLWGGCCSSVVVVVVLFCFVLFFVAVLFGVFLWLFLVYVSLQI